MSEKAVQANDETIKGYVTWQKYMNMKHLEAAFRAASIADLILTEYADCFGDNS